LEYPKTVVVAAATGVVVILVGKIMVAVVVWVDATGVGDTRIRMARSATRSTSNAESVTRLATMKSCVAQKQKAATVEQTRTDLSNGK